MKKLTVMAILALAAVSVSGAFASRNVRNNNVPEDSTSTCAKTCTTAPADTVVADSIR